MNPGSSGLSYVQINLTKLKNMLVQTTAPLVSKMYIFGKCKNVRFTLYRSMRPTCTSNFIIVSLK